MKAVIKSNMAKNSHLWGCGGYALFLTKSVISLVFRAIQAEKT
ncbi:hypothetical protein NBRC3257_2303 [Gluconobacter thailandicus NBRC 3257]|uniref:Transposase n=1 Tax=Gluconobacter thailandicus NBRC 3257 TaxID=1381097 RepID=A0ABQ0IYM1_GLUTH|nr:hypothetical protein B932_0070 [Gluconobacter oxydans H24]GAC87175.1 hypothetical protein NBRC3255_0836 [Gluconobacter thailandicus NBRC 3255]GAD27304.1 hypothetical protein NBRC3257_2303 [Gluconobacter thailandicus NBRC 3257]